MRWKVRCRCTELPLAVTAAVFKGPAPKGSVVISTLINGSTLPLTENAGMFKNDLEVIGLATDDKGKTFATDRNTVNLNMKPDTRQARQGHRLPRHPVDRPRAGPLQPAHGGSRSQHAQGRFGDVRSRGAGLFEGCR